MILFIAGTQTRTMAEGEDGEKIRARLMSWRTLPFISFPSTHRTEMRIFSFVVFVLFLGNTKRKGKKHMPPPPHNHHDHQLGGVCVCGGVCGGGNGGGGGGVFFCRINMGERRRRRVASFLIFALSFFLPVSTFFVPLPFQFHLCWKGKERAVGAAKQAVGGKQTNISYSPISRARAKNTFHLLLLHLIPVLTSVCFEHDNAWKKHMNVRL